MLSLRFQVLAGSCDQDLSSEGWPRNSANEQDYDYALNLTLLKINLDYNAPQNVSRLVTESDDSRHVAYLSESRCNAELVVRQSQYFQVGSGLESCLIKSRQLVSIQVQADQVFQPVKCLFVNMAYLVS